MSRGLPAIAQAREERAHGNVRWTTQAGLVAAGAVAAGLVVNWGVSQHELGAGKQSLLGKQRAIAATLGAEWTPLRERLEKGVLEAARSYAGDMVDAQARRREFRSQPGLYLRMRVADAKDERSIVAAAGESRKDAFAGCFLREPNERRLPLPGVAAAGSTPAPGAPGSTPAGATGDVGGGAFAEQPWNLGRAYEATRILTDGWVQSVKDADDDLRLRVFREQFDKAVRTEIPLAIDVVKRAQFFLLVLDEDVPEALPFADGGQLTEEALQLVGHPARVHLFVLPGGKEILRERRSGDARVIPAGERVVTDVETREAMQRQANNCALAGSVLSEL